MLTPARRLVRVSLAALAFAAFATPALAGAPDAASASVFGQSLVIGLREGAEAMLIFAALWAILRRMGAASASFAALAWGGLAGIAASILAAWALAAGLASSGAAAPLIEGASLLLAAFVLLFISSWLLGKREARNWRDHIESRTRGAVSGGGGAALFATGFLAIFREGAETVLFYQALLSSSSARTPALLAGAFAALAILAAAFVLVRALGMRLPLRGFFTATAWLMLALAVIYMGKGVHELQETGLIGETILAALPRIPALGLYPTPQTLTAQIALLATGLLLNRHTTAPSRSQPAE